MNEQTNTELVQQVLAAFLRNDIQTVVGSVTDDVHWTIPAIEGVPFSGHRNGREAVAKFFADLAEHQAPMKFEPREYIAQNDQVVVLGHYVWNVKSTGKTWESDYCHVFTVRNGRISGFHEFTDTAAASAAFMATGAARGVVAGGGPNAPPAGTPRVLG